ncbi:hypothetical protein PENARI_c008G03961 [Penicillium arizonense]|uniref:Rhodopsin domain-containing protein n=1 Tax=Penicillium arizonense TaxID=1835702 RepID=A0A1F5LK09_PENAI|nr:hypothetical protein PENARI_c008G03961 [Penicillium arizonense]OGE53249.1 hypothetical protein PENARI_c008G03961 [Penicillium arizonense]
MESLMPSGILQRAGIESGTRQAAVFGVGISFIVFISIVMAIRMWVRVKVIRAVGSDDIMMILGTNITDLNPAAHYGTGKHLSGIAEEVYAPMLKSIWSTRLLYVIGIMFIKLSLLWLYLRLDRHGYMKWAVYALSFVVLGLSISSALILIFSCFPPSKFWDIPGTVSGHCMSASSQQTFYEANGVLNIRKAAYTAQRKKIALTGVFGLGSLAIAAGCVRYVYVKRLAGIKDQYYELADSLNWCSIENYVAIVCGSAPSFSVLVKTYATRLFGIYYGDQVYQTYSRSHDQPLQRIADRFRADDPTITTGSQEAIVPTGGILMKTDLHMEVGPSDPTENHAEE